MPFFSTSNNSVQQVRQTPISKSTHPYFVTPFFQRMYETADQDQQIGKRAQRLITYSFWNKSSFSPVELIGLHTSSEISLNFLSKPYNLPWLRTVFKFTVFRLLEKTSVDNKNRKQTSFLKPIPRQNSPPASYHHSQVEIYFSKKCYKRLRILQEALPKSPPTNI